MNKLIFILVLSVTTALAQIGQITSGGATMTFQGGNVTSSGLFTTTNGVYVGVGTNYMGATVASIITNIPPCVSPIGLFGYAARATSNNLACAGAAGIYTNIFSSGGPQRVLTNGFSIAADGTLTNLVAGYYKITVSLAVWADADQNGDEVDIQVYLNETSSAYIMSAATLSTANINRFNTTHITYLPAGTGVSARIANLSNDASCVIPTLRMAVSIGTP